MLIYCAFCCSSMSYDIGSKLLQKVELCLFLLTLELLQFDVWHKLALELVGIEILKSPAITLCKSFVKVECFYSLEQIKRFPSKIIIYSIHM